MAGVDKRGRLEEEPFGYRTSKDGRIFVSWRGRVVTVVSGSAARRLEAALETADESSAQLLLAKATGNFKHGNERR